MTPSHVVLHLLLCASVARADEHRSVPVRVTMTDRIGRTAFEQTFPIEQGSGREADIEFDMPFGIYLAQARAAGCSATQFASFMIGVNRSLTLSLQQGGSPPRPVPAIVEGTAPFEFSYAQPTVLVFPRGAKCGEPIGTPLDADVEMDNEAASYYALVYPNRALERNLPVTVVVRMNDSHGGYQYVRVPLSDELGYAYPWPALGQVNVGPDLIDEIAGKPEDTLICVRFSGTRVGGRALGTPPPKP